MKIITTIKDLKVNEKFSMQLTEKDERSVLIVVDFWKKGIVAKDIKTNKFFKIGTTAQGVIFTRDA